ncbi:hypothetical protein [Nocardioides daeguensis]|uniref:Choice-of-anchor G family protein n=1 Tax=Nocardioides daeguensis TaxID=908359 RepID=A0ABP6WKN7_9ACTN|nr:hypothetical protein [Nocardioides daeguensis]MBV6729556.1 hypothetical protein [Nocardioides daeguensis]MCR1774988.1 hypothetical protein [Nocardioides daeguensis]
MKNKRHLAPVAGALLLVAGAATSAALLTGGSATAAGNPSSAFGLELSIAGNGVIPRTPAVTSTDGSLKSDSLIALPTNPVASGGIVNASAQNGAASASVADLAVGQDLLKTIDPQGTLTGQLNTACTQLVGQLGPVLDPVNTQVLGPLLTQLQGVLDQVATSTKDTPLNLGALGALDISKLTNGELGGLCDVLAGKLKLVGAGAVEAKCTGDAGTTTIADLRALGLPVDVDTKLANQAIKIPSMAGVPPIIELVVNRQTANADGTFTVDALYLNVLDQIKLTVASATCGNVTTGRSLTPGDAPAPKPVKEHVPVTG